MSRGATVTNHSKSGICFTTSRDNPWIQIVLLASPVQDCPCQNGRHTCTPQRTRSAKTTRNRLRVGSRPDKVSATHAFVEASLGELGTSRGQAARQIGTRHPLPRSHNRTIPAPPPPSPQQPRPRCRWTALPPRSPPPAAPSPGPGTNVLRRHPLLRSARVKVKHGETECESTDRECERN